MAARRALRRAATESGVQANSPVAPCGCWAGVRVSVILFQRLVRESLYDAACLISTRRGGGIYDEPLDVVSTRNLTAAIAGRVTYIKGLV